jgi:hypothetical protein
MWFGLFAVAHATEILAGPFAQSADPTSVWIVWETDDGDSSVVEFGADESVGTSVVGEVEASPAGTVLHRVHLTDQPPGSRLFYRARTGESASTVHALTLPPPASEQAPIRLLAMSDMQRAASHPGKFGEIVRDGVIPFVEARYDQDLDVALNGFLIPGDLVEDGSSHSDWTDDFFGGGAPLLARVTTWPVLGNHELDDPLYYAYFVLPGAYRGATAERFWTTDLGNVRVFGLDSNHIASFGEQLEWLQTELDATCADPTIDFVVAELHHPWQSELWPAGESPFTALAVERLAAFSQACGVPSVHLFGHTHGYSRGAHPEHQHLMVDVATGGGAVDRWDAENQTNYADFSISTDDWGFVLLEFTDGDDPTLRLVRVSEGDADQALDDVVTDELVIRKNGAAPNTPSVVWPLDGALPDAPPADCLTLRSGPYQDPDGDAHVASQWQIARSCDDFEEPLYDALRTSQDVYLDVDLGDADLTDDVARALPDGALCWRVRHRDADLRWSPWSDPAPFQASAARATPELLEDPGAEGEGAGWRPLSGALETPGAGRCGMPAPLEGGRVFALGVCGGEGTSSATVRVPIRDWQADVDGGTWVARVRGAFASTDGVDVTTLRLRFYDDSNQLLGETEPMSASTAQFTSVTNEHTLPVGARFIDVALDRVATSGGSSFADDLSLVLGPPGELPCATGPVVAETPAPADCSCDSNRRSPWLLAPLAALALRRRKPATL